AVRHTHGAFYYERSPLTQEGSPPLTFASTRPPPPRAASVAPGPPVLDPTCAWADDILAAGGRIAALSPRAPAPVEPDAAGPPAGGAAPPGPAALSLALDLVRQDRLAEALRALPPEDDADPEAQILRGVLLAGSGDVAGAERVCGAILALDPLHA